MFGVILQIIGTFLEEVSETLGKDNVRRRLESAWTLGFANAVAALVALLFVITCITGWGSMQMQSWPTFVLRVLLLQIQSVATVLAIVHAERSTFGFLRVGSIPLIVLIDIFIVGVALTGWQVLGMTLIAGTILLLTMNHGLSKKGIGYVLVGTVGAAVQLSLLRYNVTHGNSVELEQLGVMLVVAPTFYVLAKQHGSVAPLHVFRRWRNMVQSGLHGIAVVIGGYAFLFAPASILLAAGRAAAVMAAVLAGHLYFHEKKFIIKLLAFVGCAVGIILITLGTF
jgi:hypothetical protein